MKLPLDSVAATAFCKEPDEYDSGNFHHVVFSDTSFGDAKRAIEKLEDHKVDTAFILVGRQTFRARDVLAIMSGTKISGPNTKTEFDNLLEGTLFRSRLLELQSIFNTGILSFECTREPLFKSALTMTLILLQDLLNVASRAQIDVIVKDERGETNLIDAVRSVRNPACHIFSPAASIDACDVSFFVSRGRDKGISVGGYQVGCDFEDDVAVIFGPNKIYLKRDILAAFDLLQKNSSKIASI